MLSKASTCESINKDAWRELSPTPKQLSFIEKLREQLCEDDDFMPTTRGEAADIIEELLIAVEDYVDEFDPDLYREW